MDDYSIHEIGFDTENVPGNDADVSSLQAAGRGRDVKRAFSAVVEEVTWERGTAYVLISYDPCPACGNASTARVRLVVGRDTDIYDEWGRAVRARELQRGMTVDASFSAAMTRSIPPQAQAYFIRILARAGQTETTSGRIMDVDTRNSFILVWTGQNAASAIRFNISADTVILDFFGRRIPLSALRRGLRVRVEHAPYMTASIPPQTNAFTVQLMK